MPAPVWSSPPLHGETLEPSFSERAKAAFEMPMNLFEAVSGYIKNLEPPEALNQVTSIREVWSKAVKQRRKKFGTDETPKDRLVTKSILLIDWIVAALKERLEGPSNEEFLSGLVHKLVNSQSSATGAECALSRLCLFQKPAHLLRFPVTSVSGDVGKVTWVSLETFKVPPYDNCERFAVSPQCHPASACHLEDRCSDFFGAISDAWDAAKTEIRPGTDDSGQTGHVDLVLYHFDETAAQLAVRKTGPSAGAAFALGFHRLMTGSKYDPRVVVIGSVKKSDKGGWFVDRVGDDKIAPKVRAIVQAGTFDTIATVNDHVLIARDAVGDADVRVLDIATLPAA